MDFASSLIVLFHLVLLITEKSLCEDCVWQSTCSCKTSNYTIDFSELGKGPLNPRFHGIRDPKKSDTFYGYEPCRSLPLCGTNTTNTAICQKENEYYYYKAGNALTPAPTFSGDPEKGTLKITYTSDAGNPRRSVVSLICGSKENFTCTGENPVYQYNFRLTSPLLCPPGSGGESGKSGFAYRTDLSV